MFFFKILAHPFKILYITTLSVFYCLHLVIVFQQLLLKEPVNISDKCVHHLMQ